MSVKMLLESWRFVRRTRRAVAEDHSDAIVRALRLRDDEDRLVQLMFLEGVLHVKAHESPDARVAHAAVSDLFLSEITSLRRKARMRSSDRRDLDEMLRISKESREKIPSTPVFETKVETLKRELVARSRDRSAGM